MIAVRVKERFYNPQAKTQENRFLDILVMDKSGKLFEFIEKNPRKYVTGIGTLQVRVYDGKPQFSILSDNNDGFSFADCIDREAIGPKGDDAPTQGFDDFGDTGNNPF
jgi:hypothetical protein